MKETHPCERCGNLTTNRIYCSNRCTSSRPMPHLRKNFGHPCENCGTVTRNKKYCSRSCSAAVNNTTNPKRGRQIRPLITLTCSTCQQEFTTREGRLKQFCGKKCQVIAQCPWTPETLFVRDENIARSTVKTWLLRWNIMKLECSRCGIDVWMDEPAPIDLDHINGDKHDHRLENLRMLCANCHRQTPTHGWKNARRKKTSAS